MQQTKNASQIVEDHFGEDFGAWLMMNNMIIPVRDDKTPMTSSWKNFKSSELDKMQFDGLAVVMNRRINVLDIDTREYVFGEPNVITEKGAHYWFTPDSNVVTKHLRGVGDIKTNGYVVFYGLNKEFNNSSLSEWNELREELLNVLPPPLYGLLGEGTSINSLGEDTSIVSTYDVSVLGIGMKSREKVLEEGIGITYATTPYLQRVKDEGYTLDRPAIQKGLCTMMNQCKSGRNNRLFRIAIEFHRLELDLDELEKVALSSGLGAVEIRSTIESAETYVDANFSVSVLDRVMFWKNTVCHYVQLTENQKVCVDEVARRAVEMNTLKPSVSQLGIERSSGVSRTYAQATLNRILPKLGFLEKEQNVGFFISDTGQKMRHCNNYYLCINSLRLSENLSELDELINKGDRKYA